MSTPRTVFVLAAGAAITTGAGFLIGAAWLFPILGSLVPLIVFLPLVKEGRPARAAAWVLLWAVFQSIALGVAVQLAPDRAAEVVLRGPAYAEEMLHWIRTGEGPEGSPRLFLPIHLRHYLAFCVLSVLSVGTLGLVLGTVLLNYMNFYVAQLVRESSQPVLALGFGWPVWAVIRVAGFVVTGAATARIGWIGLNRLRGIRIDTPLPLRVFGAGSTLR